jgi:hypothetical protein
MWSALYQGRPTAAGAEYINPAWLKTWTAPPSTATADEVWFTVDASQGVGKDQTAIQVWARHDRTWSLIERLGGQDLTIPRLVEALALLWARYGADVLRAPGGVLIEGPVRMPGGAVISGQDIAATLTSLTSQIASLTSRIAALEAMAGSSLPDDGAIGAEPWPVREMDAERRPSALGLGQTRRRNPWG